MRNMPENIPIGFSHEISSRDEILRRTITEFKNIDRKNIDIRELEDIYEILTDPVNEIHLANPPENLISLIMSVQGQNTHYFTSRNALGEIVSVATIADAPGNINSHEIGNFAVNPKIQRQTERNPMDKSVGAGRFTLEQIVLHGFTHPTWNNRERIKLRAGVMTHMTQMQEGRRVWVPVPRADIMVGLLKKTGFQPYATSPDGIDAFVDNQVTKVDLKTGENVHFRVTPYELHRDTWEQFRHEGRYFTYNAHDFSSDPVLAAD